MTAYENDLIRIIDQRVRKHLISSVAVGTIQQRTTDGNYATVVLDGSTVAVPCKVFANVLCLAGDRVGLVQFGSEWVIVGTYTQRAPGHAAWNAWLTVSGTHNSNTLVDLPEPINMTFVKLRDATRVRMFIATTAFVTIANTECIFSMVFSDNTGVLSPITFDGIASLYVSTANAHVSIAGENWSSIGQVPAGEWSVAVRWRRVTGTGLMTQNGGDWIHASVEERL